jgi:hypothetical protein
VQCRRYVEGESFGSETVRCDAPICRIQR